MKLATPTYGDLDKFVFASISGFTAWFLVLRYVRRHFSSYLFDNDRATFGVLRVTLNVSLALLQVLFEASKFSLNLNCVRSNLCVLILGGQCGYQIDAKFWKIISNQHGVNLPRGSTPGLDRAARPGVLMEDSIGGSSGGFYRMENIIGRGMCTAPV